MMNKAEYTYADIIRYDSREERNTFFADYIKNNVINSPILNVGSGGQRFLQKKLAGYDITDIDMQGDVDHIVNLEKDKLSFFSDKSFKTSICLDVMEHVENFHEIFDELLRVSEEKIIISLPNCPASYFRNLLFGRYPFKYEQRKEFGCFDKYTGIPFEPVNDRHKWFFSFDEAIDFFEYQAEKKNIKIERIFFVGGGGWKYKVIRRVLPRIYRNFIPYSFCIVIDVRSS